ncbi:MAG: hypothetical protein DRG31_03550 [Deltaproteobacteria bacterium]|mgnify:CR=1 FL=1|nr:MAG: hypothetical protein DRG31_03550 [Deltaproteobacteria bacterium]
MEKSFDVIALGPLALEYVYEISDPAYVADLGLREGDDVIWRDRDQWLLRDRLMIFGELKAVNPGAAAVSTLRVLTALDFRTAIVGTLGRDREAEEFIRSLGREDTTRIVRKGRTGIVYHIILRGGGRFRVVFPGDSLLSKEELDCGFLARSRWIHMVPFLDRKGLEVQRDLRAKVGEGVGLSLDYDSAPLEPGALLQLLQGVEIFFARERDLGFLMAGEEREVVGRILRKVKVLVINRSKGGVSLHVPGGDFHFKPQEGEDLGEVHDVLVGLFLAHHLSGYPPQKALERAARGALLAVGGHGPERYPKPEELKEIEALP